MEQISSRQNALVKRIRALAREPVREGEVLLDGPHLLGEAAAAGLNLLIAVFSQTGLTRHRSLVELAESRGARTAVVPDALLDSLSPARQSSGVLATARMERRSVEDVLRVEPQLVLVLHAVQDPGNVGAVVRAAEGCGATGVLTTPGTADVLGWKALRGAMGSAFRLPVAAAASVHAAVEDARAAGLQIIAAVPRGGTPLPDVFLSAPAAIIVGGEGGGIPADIAESADDRLTIDMRPPVESLNVAIAAALIVYEASRQRTHVAVR